MGFYCLSCDKYYTAQQALVGCLCPVHERPLKEVK